MRSTHSVCVGVYFVFSTLWSAFYSPAYSLDNHAGLPIYPIRYRDAAKEEQRQAGVRIVDAINLAAKSEDKEFTVPAGIYRIPEGSGFIKLENIHNGFRLNLKDVEFVMEDHRPLFQLIDCRNVEIVGPVIVDCDPSPCIQGWVHDYDRKNGRVTMKVAEGFPLEVAEKVVKVFSPDGQWLKNPQWNECLDYKIIDPEERIVAFTPKQTKDGTEEIFTQGNQMVVGYGNVMFACRRVENLTLKDIDCHHGGGLMWGQDGGGNWQLRRVNSTPRPGTCRLTGGHALQVSFKNGALTMDECEFSSNTGTARNVVIRNNSFHETSHRQGWASGDAAIIIGPMIAGWPKAPEAYAFENITITGNSITNSSGGGVKISNASQIHISDNTIDGLFLEKPPAGAFNFKGCEAIKIGPNQVTRCPGPTMQTVDCRNIQTEE